MVKDIKRLPTPITSGKQAAKPPNLPKVNSRPGAPTSVPTMTRQEREINEMLKVVGE